MAYQLRDFEILDKLGEGAYSSVYKVKRHSDGKIYALKRVKLSTLSEQEKQNALNEVRIIASVRHPNIVNFKQCFIDPHSDCLCIIMEYVDNGDLLSHINKHIKNGTYFEEKEIWNALIQIVKGLQSLHSLNIYHRDLKSANVFVNKDGSIKLGDFNVSKICKQGLLYTQTGTPYYASPEVWRDLPYDSKADIWSVGCIIYEMCALKPPFRAEDMPSLFKKVVKGQYSKIPSFYMQNLSKIIRSMLQVSPHLRPSCKRILSDEIVMSHMNERHLEEPDEQEKSILISTIKFPLNFNSKGQKIDLPKPNYQPVKTRRRISSNMRLMTTFDQNESLLQQTNKSMMEDQSDRTFTETSHQQAISQRNQSQRQISYHSVVDYKLPQNSISLQDQTINQQNNSSNITQQKVKLNNNSIGIDKINYPHKNEEKRKSSSISLNPYLNYINHLDKISNIELSDQLLHSINDSKSSNIYSLQQNLSNQQNIINLQNNITNNNNNQMNKNNNMVSNQKLDNSKSVSIVDKLESKNDVKQSVSTNENRKKINNVRQSNSLTSQAQAKGYTQRNKQKQLYKIMNQPAHLLNQGKQQQNNTNLQNSTNNTILNSQYPNNQENTARALRDSLIALEKNIIKSTRGNRKSIIQDDQDKQFHDNNTNLDLQNQYAQLSNNNTQQQQQLSNDQSRIHRNSAISSSSIKTQKNTINVPNKDVVNFNSNKENIFDSEYPSQSSPNNPTLINKKQTNQSQHNNNLQYRMSNIYLNRHSIHIPQSTTSQNDTQFKPLLLDSCKSPAQQPIIGYRQKSKTIFETNNNNIPSESNPYTLLRNKKEKVIQNTSRKHQDFEDENEQYLIKMNRESIQYNNINHQQDNMSQNNDKQQGFLPAISSIKNNKGDRSSSVQRKQSPSYLIQNINNNNHLLIRNPYNIFDIESKRKNQEIDQKIQELTDQINQKTNIATKQNSQNQKHIHNQIQINNNDQFNIYFEQENLTKQRIHSNVQKQGKITSLSPRNNRNPHSKLL